MMGGGGGWQGPERSLGGLSRTFGLRPPDPGVASGKPLDRALLRRAVGLLRPYLRPWMAILLCIAATAALGVLPPMAVRGILDNAIPHRDLPQLFWLVGAIVGVNIVSGLISVLQSYLSAIVGEGVLFDLRNQLFQHLQRFSLGFYTNTRSGEIVARVNSDVTAVQGAVTGTPIAIASNALTVAATIIAIVTLNPVLALLSLIVVPGLYLPTRLVGKFRRQLALKAQETQADLTAFLSERLHVGGMLLTKTFGQAGTDADEFAALSRRARDINIRQSLAGRWLFMSLSVFSVTGPALIYAYGGFASIHGRLSIGSVIAIVAYLANLYRPLSSLANVYVDVQAALGIFERIFGLLDTAPEVSDTPDATALPEPVRGHFVVEDVSFSYPRRPSEESDTPPPTALDNISFEIQPGERVALVGPSGAGKTTLTYLLPRFFDPSAGRILLDGHDLRGITQESLRAQIGMVTQETFLFHDSVRANLRYARPGATDAQLEDAARQAQIHDVIAALPDGYDTIVGERAFRLSGGERQRLSIARALLKDPKILILDEATSALDATSEHRIQQALSALLAGRTSLTIAHRLSTIVNADRILVLQNGRLVESGAHDALLAENGLYASLYRRQFGKTEPVNR